MGHGARKLDRLLDGGPAVAARSLVLGNAFGHLVIQRLRRGDIDPRRRRRHGEDLRVAALARASAAEHECQAPAPGGVRLS